jgi:hypothetical protein
MSRHTWYKKLLTPFHIFQIHHAILLHYTTDYSYQLYHGQTSYKEETFEKRKDKYAYHKMGRIFEDAYDAKEIEYYFAWMFFRTDKWVTTRDISNATLLSYELEWKNYSAGGRLGCFNMDVRNIQVAGGFDPQTVFNLCFQGDVHFATLLILDKLKGVLKIMDDKLKGQYLWDEKYKKLKKFNPFYLTHEPIQEIDFRQHIPENLICQDVQ